MSLSRSSASIILACILTTLCACGWFKKDKPPAQPEPTRVVIEIETAGDINPSITNRPSPVVVRIYQLRSYADFKKADFTSLYENGNQALGKDLIDQQEIFVKPGEKRTVFFEAPDDLRTVGIMAAFRYYQKGQWKVSTGIQPNKTNVVNVFINGTNVQLK